MIASTICAAAAPGAREMASIVKVWELAQRERWKRGAEGYDSVIVDAPASGHGIGMLRTPRTFANLARVGPIHSQSERVGELLRDKRRTGYLAVALAEEMPVNETLELQRALPGAVGCPRPLLIPAGPGQLWAWANSYEPVELDALEQAALKLCGVHVGVGAWSTGPEGLRRSHEEALHARRVARLAGVQPVPVTCYRDVVVASLLSADLERSQRFVIDTLGPLAAASDYTVRLRETLRAFLAEGSSHVGVARRLHVHENTVAYRVHRAEELMGHPLAARRLETELALALVQVLGDAVLTGAPDS